MSSINRPDMSGMYGDRGDPVPLGGKHLPLLKLPRRDINVKKKKEEPKSKTKPEETETDDPPTEDPPTGVINTDDPPTQPVNTDEPPTDEPPTQPINNDDPDTGVINNDDPDTGVINNDEPGTQPLNRRSMGSTQPMGRTVPPAQPVNNDEPGTQPMDIDFPGKIEPPKAGPSPSARSPQGQSGSTGQTPKAPSAPEAIKNPAAPSNGEGNYVSPAGRQSLADLYQEAASKAKSQPKSAPLTSGFGLGTPGRGTRESRVSKSPPSIVRDDIPSDSLPEFDPKVQQASGETPGTDDPQESKKYR